MTFGLYLFLLLITDIEENLCSHKKVPDLFFPIAQAEISECSTFTVVCRLKASPTYTITSSGGSFSHPDFPDVTVTIPENAVTPSAKLPLELKVGLFKYMRFAVDPARFSRSRPTRI